MADSNLSASELRQRYQRGGTAKDDELTSAQLRARHAIPGNSSEFSTSQKESDYTSVLVVIIMVFIVAIVVILLNLPKL